jgi:hypothetical protein
MSTRLKRARLLAAELAAALTLLFALLFTVGFYEAGLASCAGRGSAVILSLLAFSRLSDPQNPATARPGRLSASFMSLGDA